MPVGVTPSPDIVAVNVTRLPTVPGSMEAVNCTVAAGSSSVPSTGNTWEAAVEFRLFVITVTLSLTMSELFVPSAAVGKNSMLNVQVPPAVRAVLDVQSLG